MKQLKSAKNILGSIDSESALQLIAIASDVALIIDKKGIIRDLTFDRDEPPNGDVKSWIGKAWIDTVTAESRPKVEAILRDAAAHAEPRWREINHPTRGGPDFPIKYFAVPLNAEGRIIAIGRDLRAFAALQQRLIEAQTSMEREYQRLRDVETRYRALFHLSSEAVLIVDSSNGRVIEANPAAVALLSNGAKKIVGKPLEAIVGQGGENAVQELLASVRTSPQVENIVIKGADGKREFLLSGSLFRQGMASYVLVRLSSAASRGSAPAALSRAKSFTLHVVDALPDGFVVANASRQVVSANPAFLELAQLATEEQLRGEPVDRWLGRVAVDLDVLFASLREHQSIRNYSTVVRGEYGTATPVDVSAVAIGEGHPSYYGFVIRKAAVETSAVGSSMAALPRTVEQMTKLVGRVALKDLVRESTDLIEKLCIEAALVLTDDNRASAAEMLGLSRQSLYVKLRRFGLDNTERG